MGNSSRITPRLLVFVLVLSSAASARGHGHTHAGHGGHHGGFVAGGGGFVGSFNGAGLTVHRSSYFSTFGAFTPIFVPVWPVASPWPMGMNGPIGGPMPRLATRPAVLPLRRTDPAKSTQLVTIGDRLFRVGNTKRAADRYQQARKLNPDAAEPLIRLAQLALLHGDYSKAAEHFRGAVAVQPDYLVNAPNITSMYAEPGDFRKQLSRLESRVLVEPSDRDAWLVLGAELFLSGQTKRAADVFLRLTDRRGDPALAAFLQAATP